jgi:hypothetical protein
MFTVLEPGTVGPETYCDIFVNASYISYDTSISCIGVCYIKIYISIVTSCTS